MTKEEKLMLRELYSSANTDQRLILEKLFPELKESEDEKTRKELTEFLKSASEGHLEISTPYKTFGKWLAWLEKQNDNTLIAEIKRRKELLLREKDKACSLNERLSLGGRIAMLEELLAFTNEKQDESTDKVEPKFKVGDWILLDKPCQIESMSKHGNYIVKYSDDDETSTLSKKFCETYFHLWSIQDAKEGDVLVSDGVIFIFNKIHGVWINCHCCLYKGDSFYNEDYDLMNIKYGKEVYPATKEQCNLLFQKMKEAGYKWENNQLEEIGNNEDVVDLGLPSGTLWAKCNLGADKETDFGKFFQWGDTQGYEEVDEHSFKWNDYKHGSYEDLTKYNISDSKSELDYEDDPVFVTTNGKFKMPTNGQLQELIDYTNHEWVSIDGVNGMKFINKKDDTKYIFIPAAGVCRYDSHSDVGSLGCVWSASINESNNNCTWDMYIKEGEVCLSDSTRCLGYSIRGVLNK